ncbi:MAG: DUF4340 domain-containing protein [Oscillospiraceae bacterium]|nr:DUF4340 domain-containing protein [Oscillospiraceae bacterium]
MIRGKTFIALIIALVVLVGAILAVNLLTPEETVEDTTVTLFSMETSEASQISWTYDGETMHFMKLSDTWLYADDSSFPLDSSYIDAMLETLSQVTATRKLENVGNLSEYGLDDPVCVINLQTDEKVEFAIGNLSAIGDSRYLSVGDGNVYLVDAAILNSFEYTLYDVVAKEELPAMTDVTRIQVVRQDNQLDIQYLENSGLTYSNEFVWFLNQNGSYRALDEELTEELLAGITELSWHTCITHNADASALEMYGLTDPAVTVSIDYLDENGEGAVFGLELGNVSGDYCYAKLTGSNMVYKIEGALRETLMYSTYHDLQPNDVLLMDWDVVTGVDVILDGVTYEIRQTEEGDNTVMMLDGTEAEITTIRNILDSMDSAGFADGAAPEQSMTIGFKFYRDAETFQEVELVFYPFDSANCLASLNGEARFYVSRERVTSLVQAASAIVGA